MVWSEHSYVGYSTTYKGFSTLFRKSAFLRRIKISSCATVAATPPCPTLQCPCSPPQLALVIQCIVLCLLLAGGTTLYLPCEHLRASVFVSVNIYMSLSFSAAPPPFFFSNPPFFFSEKVRQSEMCNNG